MPRSGSTETVLWAVPAAPKNALDVRFAASMSGGSLVDGAILSDSIYTSSSICRGTIALRPSHLGCYHRFATEDEDERNDQCAGSQSAARARFALAPLDQRGERQSS